MAPSIQDIIVGFIAKKPDKLSTDSLITISPFQLLEDKTSLEANLGTLRSKQLEVWV